MKIKTKNNINSSKSIDVNSFSNISDNALISVLQNLPVAVVIFSETNILFINKEAFKILKLTKALEKKITDYSIFDFLLPEYHQRVKENSSQLLKGQEFVPFELKIKNAKNKIVNVEAKSNAIIFNGKQVIQTILTDISNQVKHREELSLSKVESEQKWINYKRLLDSSPIGIFIHQGICIYANKTAATILEEKNENNLIGKNLVDFIIPEQQQIAKEKVELAIKGIESKDSMIYKAKTIKGNIIEIELRSVPFIYESKNCVQTIITNISNEIKLADEKLKTRLAEKTNAILVKVINERNATQAKLNTIFNTSTHIIWTIDENYKLSAFNQNYYKQLDIYYNYKIKIGIDFKKLYKQLLNKQDYLLWIEKYTLAFTGKNVLFETKKQTQEGDFIYREIYLNPRINDEGKVVEVIAISHNITNRKINEQIVQEQSAKLKAIFESGKQLMWTVDKNYFFTSFNQNFSDSMFNVYGVKPLIEQKVYNPAKSKKEIEYHNWWINKYNQVFKSKKSIEFITEQIDKTKKAHYRQVFLHPIYGSRGVVEEISCVSNDITELNYLKNETANQAAKLSSVFESTSHIIWIVNKNFELINYNQNFIDLCKNSYNKNPIKGKRLEVVLSKNDSDYWAPLYKKGLKGTKLKFEITDFDKKGNEYYREIHLTPIRNQTGEIIEIACVAHDITENKKFEKQIIEQSAKLQAIFESGNQLMWTISRDYTLTSLNQNYSNAIFDLYGFYPKEGKSIREIGKEKTKPFESIWDQKYAQAFGGKQVELSTERIKMDGTQVYRQYYLYPIKNINNEVVEVSGIGFDVTQNRQNEEKIIQSLKEKEILLKEVHHRVKNNMQVISSILNLQSSYVKDTYALNLLKECQNRIKSMAFIHESLYQTKNFESVNFSEYVSTLTKNLVHTYSVNTQKIKLILTLDNLFLNLDSSIPCGLIINEIISNSLKYAFPNNRDGIIFVILKVNKQKIKIEIGDNGIGLPKLINIKNTKTLGLQLVDTLIEQIGGTFILDTTKGTKFIIEFNQT